MSFKKEKTLANISVTAIKMIVNLGFDGFSMHKLAKAANISVATIYIYFANKEDLLNKLFLEVDQKFNQFILTGFDSRMPFKAGLWKQWENRYQYVVNYKIEHQFSDQFRHSPLIHPVDTEDNPFKKAMNDFVENSVLKGELRQLQPEVYWSLAYGPLYTLIKIHLDWGKGHFTIDAHQMKKMFDLTLKSLTP